MELMNLALFSAGLTGLRNAYELLKAGYSARNANQIATATGEALSQLSAAWESALASHKEQLALAEQVGELKKEIAKLKDWEREAERYQLTSIAPGIPAYVMKTEMESSKEAHHLCATCFEKREKVYLQNGPSTKQWRCSQCGGDWLPADRQAGPLRVQRT